MEIFGLSQACLILEALQRRISSSMLRSLILMPLPLGYLMISSASTVLLVQIRVLVSKVHSMTIIQRLSCLRRGKETKCSLISRQIWIFTKLTHVTFITMPFQMKPWLQNGQTLTSCWVQRTQSCQRVSEEPIIPSQHRLWRWTRMLPSPRMSTSRASTLAIRKPVD